MRRGISIPFRWGDRPYGWPGTSVNLPKEVVDGPDHLIIEGGIFAVLLAVAILIDALDVVDDPAPTWGSR
jgi:hypothetical protein